MQEYIFQDTSFVLTESAQYNLSIQVSLDGFSFVVHHPITRAIPVFHYHPFLNPGHQFIHRKIKDIIADNELLRQPYGQTEILFSAPLFFLLPAILFSDKLGHYLLQSKPGFTEEYETIVIPLQQPESHLVFAAGKMVYDYLTGIFPGAAISHEVTRLIHYTLSGQAPLLHFHMHDTWFYALENNGKGIGFLNTFDYRSETDLIYFMLSVLSKIKIKAGSIPVTLSGPVSFDSEKLRMIREHIPNAAVAAFPDRLTSAPGNLPFHCLPGILSF